MSFSVRVYRLDAHIFYNSEQMKEQIIQSQIQSHKTFMYIFCLWAGELVIFALWQQNSEERSDTAPQFLFQYAP